MTTKEAKEFILKTLIEWTKTKNPELHITGFLKEYIQKLKDSI